MLPPLPPTVAPWLAPSLETPAGDVSCYRQEPSSNRVHFRSHSPGRPGAGFRLGLNGFDLLIEVGDHIAQLTGSASVGIALIGLRDHLRNRKN